MAATSESAESSALVDGLVELSFVVQEVLARVTAAHNLSVTQLRLLGILRDRTPPMTAIAEHLGLNPSSVTGLVSRAERWGLVSRTASKNDARVTIVHITSRGRQVGAQLAATVSDELRALIRHVPKTERDRMVRVAAAVVDAAWAGRGINQGEG